MGTRLSDWWNAEIHYTQGARVRSWLANWR